MSSNQVENDEEMKRKIRAELRPVSASSSSSSTGAGKATVKVDKDEELKMQIQKEMSLKNGAIPQAEKVADMTQQMMANTGAATATIAASQAEQDEAMKKQIKAELNKNRPSMNSSSSKSQVETDAETKGQIKEQVEASAPTTTSPNPPPVDAVSPGRAAGRRGRRNQSDEDAAAKAQIRASREARTSEPKSMELGRELSGLIVGDSVDPLQVSSVTVESREAAMRNSSTELQEANSKGHLTKKGQQDTSAVAGERPGAFPVQTRAYGGLPAWVRRQNQRNQPSNSTNEVNLPPEMRGMVQQEQSNLPPEMRTLAAEPADEADDMIPTAEVNAVRIDDKGSGGGGRNRMWIYVIGGLVLIGAILGVVIGVTSGNGGSSDENLSTSGTESPTAEPTAFWGYQCPEYDGLLPYTDPNLDHIEDEDVSDFYAALVAAHGSKFGYSGPESPQDYCSPTHLAFVWTAHELNADGDDPQKLENHLALALLYFSWRGIEDSSDWFSNLDECSWTGITCDESKNLIEIKVTVVTDNNQGLEIPSEIGLLTDLSRFLMEKWSRRHPAHFLTKALLLLTYFRCRIVEACRW
jgi:hypothetical protein